MSDELEIRVTPRASANKVVGEKDGVLQIRVTAPPADGDANAAVIKLLAKHLGVPKSSLKIIRGEKSRNKTIRISR